MIKKIAIITGAVATIALTGCGAMNLTEPVIVRKLGNDTLWVKTIKDNSEAVQSFKVKNDYYLTAEPGQTFKSEYAISSGITEYTYSW